MVLTATSGVGATVSKLYLHGSGEPTEIPKGSGGANWSVSSDGTMTLKKAFLATLEADEDAIFTVTFTKDNPVGFTITIVDSTPYNSISPETATFDLNTSGANYDDIDLTATSLCDAWVSHLYIGTTEIEKGEDDANWSVDDGAITLKKEYLSTLSTGDVTFTFIFSTSNSVDVTVTVEDTT